MPEVADSPVRINFDHYVLTSQKAILEQSDEVINGCIGELVPEDLETQRIEKLEAEDVGYGNGLVLLFQALLHEL